MIRTEALTKRYRDLMAVDDLDLHVRPGEIYGFLGPNGAGKTTTILMLLGLVTPTSGMVRLFGRDLAREPLPLKRQIGVVCEPQALYDDLTAEEYLRFFAELYEVPNPARRIWDVLEALELQNRRRGRVGAYSHGMQQKLGLARALLHDPPLLILDEPVSGLDPVGIRQVRELLVAENARGKTIFISSHVLSEIERTAHRIGVLIRGRLIAQGTMAELRRRLEDAVHLKIELQSPADRAARVLEALPFVDHVRADGPFLDVRTPGGHDHRAEVAAAIAGTGAIVVGMRAHEMSLEDAFIALAEERAGVVCKPR